MAPQATRSTKTGNIFFEPSQIAARKETRERMVEEIAPVVNTAVNAIVQAALANAVNPEVQILRPLAGSMAGECAESASKIACNTLVIPGAAAAERGSGIVKDKIDNLC